MKVTLSQSKQIQIEWRRRLKKINRVHKPDGVTSTWGPMVEGGS